MNVKDIVLSKYGHLLNAYTSESEMIEHFMSGEVQIKFTDCVDISREAREQVINELVGWMEMQQLQHSHKSHVFSTLSYCIKKAKSLLNQQGEETKCQQHGAFNYFDDESGLILCSECKRPI